MPVAAVSLKLAQRIMNSAPGLWEEVEITSADGSDGDFTAGPLENTTLAQDSAGVIGELEIGSDADLSNAVAAAYGHFVNSNEFLYDNVVGTMDIDLEKQGNGDASNGAKVGLGIVDDPEKPIANAMPFTEHRQVNADDTSRINMKKLTPFRSGVIGLAGEHMTLVAKTPPTTSEGYGMDHTIVEDIPAVKLTGRGLRAWQERRGL